MITLGERYYTQEELKKFGFKRLGKDVQIARDARLCGVENMSIGDRTRIDSFTVIVASREEVNIGHHVHITSLCYFSGREGLEIGDFCSIAPGVRLFTASDDYTGNWLTNPTVPKALIGGPEGKIALGDHVIIGTNSAVLPNVTVSEGIAIGANSLILANTKLIPWSIYAGSPAKWLGERSKKLLSLVPKVKEYELDPELED